VCVCVCVCVCVKQYIMFEKDLLMKIMMKCFKKWNSSCPWEQSKTLV